MLKKLWALIKGPEPTPLHTCEHPDINDPQYDYGSEWACPECGLVWEMEEYDDDGAWWGPKE